MMLATRHTDLPALAAHLREVLSPTGGNKKCVLLYAYNGTGKTRLSMEFRALGKVGDTRDTLYFNAFTEDLFFWDNDLDSDADRKLRLNRDSKFFDGLDQLEMDNRIRRLLVRYADFDFRIDTTDWVVSFSREVSGQDDQSNPVSVTLDNIKVSRGEENIFIWCFFLAIAQLAIDAEEGSPYDWVQYVYIDDPISSLDEHNAIGVACQLAALIKGQDRVRAVISTHHTLFFNVLHNELGKAQKLVLQKSDDGSFSIRDTRDTPAFYHVASLVELKKAADSGVVYTYHFNLLRSLMEKAASFHGLPGWKACLQRDGDDDDGVIQERRIALFNHGGYSLFEPVEMIDDNKAHFRRVLHEFLVRFPFNPAIFDEAQQAAPA